MYTNVRMYRNDFVLSLMVISYTKHASCEVLYVGNLSNCSIYKMLLNRQFNKNKTTAKRLYQIQFTPSNTHFPLKATWTNVTKQKHLYVKWIYTRSWSLRFFFSSLLRWKINNEIIFSKISRNLVYQTIYRDNDVIIHL